MKLTFGNKDNNTASRRTGRQAAAGSTARTGQSAGRSRPADAWDDRDDGSTGEPSTWQKIVGVVTNETVCFVVGLLLVIFSVYLLLAFTSFLFTGAADQSLIDPAAGNDLSAVDNGVSNYAGSRGAQLAQFLINRCFGLASIFLIIFLAVLGLKLMRVRRIVLWKWFLACVLLTVWTSIFLGFAFANWYADSFIYLGGLHGYNVSRWLVSQVGEPGLWLLLVGIALIFLVCLSRRSMEALRSLFSLSFLKRKEKVDGGKSDSDAATVRTESTPATGGEPATDAPVPASSGSDDLSVATDADDHPAEDLSEAPSDGPEPPKDNGSQSSAAADGEATTDGQDETSGPVMTVEVPTDENPQVAADGLQKHPDDPTAQGEGEPEFTVGPTAEEDIVRQMEPYNPRLDLEYYRFPTLDLMTHYDDTAPSVDMDEQNANKDRIISTLRSFGIEIRSIKATVGPTVTLYEITPEEGIRIAKIRNLEDDIALRLSALGIRIIAPIPGKGTIGIEVPNTKKRVVSGQSVIGSRRFQESDYALPIALGKTITNEVFMFDLTKMPHLLVAGATGMGKSVGLNAIITSLLYKKHPAELKFVLVDPKKVEFSIYSSIENHYLAKLPDDGEAIITDTTKVVQTLSSLCVEMDARYDLLKTAQVRNVKEYNERFTARRLNPEKGHRYLPYIVVIIDEFADLIMTAGKEVELPIARIAQLARAVGIHMIIATQRPTTNIITGTIKANFPARIAFRVQAMVDSRTILDRTGANQLIGRGDMLFSNGGELVRVQCAFIDTPEVERITQFIARQQGYPTPFYLPEYVGEGSDGSVEDVDMGRLDSLFEEAARLIVIHQQGSTSLIQRKFSIGYNRAGRLMDQLEKAGIVGPTQGSKPRDVLCADEMELEARLKNIL